MRYFVHVFRTMRFKVAVEANDHDEAMKKADAQMPDAIKRSEWDLVGDVSYERDLAGDIANLPALLHCEDAEETTAYLIDEVDDTEYERTQRYFTDGEKDDCSRQPS